MEHILALALALQCSPTLIINESNQKWNNTDTQNYEHARLACPKKYKESVCLKRFTKVRELTYHAICGKPNSPNNQ